MMVLLIKFSLKDFKTLNYFCFTFKKIQKEPLNQNILAIFLPVLPPVQPDMPNYIYKLLFSLIILSHVKGLQYLIMPFRMPYH